MDELKAKLLATLEKLREISAKAESEARDFTDDERTQVKSLMDEAKDHKDALVKAQDKIDLKSAIASLGDGVSVTDPVTNPLQPPVEPGKGGSLGEQFVNAPKYRDWMKQVAREDGAIPDSKKGLASPPVEFKTFPGLFPKKDVVTADSVTSAGALVFPQDLGLRDVGTFQRPLVLRDLFTIGQTGTDEIQYVRVTGFTNAAAPTAEATAVTGTSGTKPESGLELERVSTTVKTIPHWMPATKKALSDAGQIRTLIDSFLNYGLAEEVEDQVISGDGTGENFEGLENVSGVQSQPYSATVTGLDPLLETTRKAKTLVKTGGRAIATAYAFNPNDWEAIELARMAVNPQYDFGGVIASRLHGLAVVESEAITEGTGWVADWRQGVIWDREQASISVSDSHADFFVRNMVAILAELRAAFGVFRPAAFVTIDLTA